MAHYLMDWTPRKNYRPFGDQGCWFVDWFGPILAHLSEVQNCSVCCLFLHEFPAIYRNLPAVASLSNGPTLFWELFELLVPERTLWAGPIWFIKFWHCPLFNLALDWFGRSNLCFCPFLLIGLHQLLFNFFERLYVKILLKYSKNCLLFTLVPPLQCSDSFWFLYSSWFGCHTKFNNHDSKISKGKLHEGDENTRKG